MADEYLQCELCAHAFVKDDAGPPVYECGTCGQPQAGEEDARRCEQCHRFCAKIADYSCPECEAPADEIKSITDSEFKAVEEERCQDEAERERRAKEPHVESEYEKEWKRQRQVQQEAWSEPDSLGDALRDIPAEQSSFSDGTLGGKFEKCFVGGSIGLGISIEEATAICEKIKHLEQQVREWSGQDD